MRNGLPPHEIVAPENAGKLRQWCYERAREIFRNGPVFDAIIAYSGVMAMKILDAAGEYGFRAPEDFSIIGFDNLAFGRLRQIQLTSVSQCESRIGQLAVERLLDRINGSGTPTADPLQPELMIRSTCRRICGI